jgi:hypothetical protein
MTDTDRIDALEKMGSIAIWHGSWASHVPVDGGKQIRAIYEVDADGSEICDEYAKGETIREAIDRCIDLLELTSREEG